jgi:putative ATP-dependent endonuclease of OLD family
VVSKWHRTNTDAPEFAGPVLLHIALTAATLDVEATICGGGHGGQFDETQMVLPALTLLAVEEPENSLAPYYLARIVTQLQDLAEDRRAQGFLSSHSASVLRRIEPRSIRHFQLHGGQPPSRVRALTLPQSDLEAEKYVREAVQAFPELYFARYVVLGEGSSEVVVLPRLASALGLTIDQSFVAVVPLGGRHVNHLWRLLTDLQIPFATLLDLDRGRLGGGWSRLKTAHQELLNVGVPVEELVDGGLTSDALLESFNNRSADDDLQPWLDSLRRYNVFFCDPLDLDWAMLRAYPSHYRRVPDGLQGPSSSGDVHQAVLGTNDESGLYATETDLEDLRWYRYHFLGRGKPTTHLHVLAEVTDDELAAAMPDELGALLAAVRAALPAT